MNIIDVKVAPASIRGITLAKIMDVCMYVFRRVNFQIKTYNGLTGLEEVCLYVARALARLLAAAASDRPMTLLPTVHASGRINTKVDVHFSVTDHCKFPKIRHLDVELCEEAGVEFHEDFKDMLTNDRETDECLSLHLTTLKDASIGE